MDNRNFVNALAKSLKRDKEDVTKMIDALCNVVKTRCGELDSIAVPGFGSFEGKKREERVLTLPSGKRMLVPPKITISFKTSNVLKNRLS